MSVCVVARSISRPVWERLRRRPERVEEGRLFSARVLAVFEHTCDLVTADGDVVAVVAPQIGDGPLNIVLEREGVGFATVEPGTQAQLLGGRLQVGGLEVILGSAVIWEPRPDWDGLRARHDAFVDRLPLLRTLSLRQAPERSLLVLAPRWTAGPSHPPQISSLDSISDGLFVAVREATQALQAGWEGDSGLLQAGAVQLAGLGSGLTPAGDDFITGVMLWGWLAHPSPGFLCRVLVEAAAPHTTTLSAAFLRSAARGECSAAWHALLAALAHGSDEEVAGAVQGVLAHGATSGADALAGFLWTALFSA